MDYGPIAAKCLEGAREGVRVCFLYDEVGDASSSRSEAPVAWGEGLHSGGSVRLRSNFTAMFEQPLFSRIETGGVVMDGGFEFIDLGTDDPRVIAMRITGKLRAEVIAELVERLEAVGATGQKSLVYIDLVTFEGSELAVVREKLAHMRTLWNSIERLAYVLDVAWMSKLIGLVDAVTPMHLRAFGHDQDEEARAWLLSGGP